jgi:hypothetical protein
MTAELEIVIAILLLYILECALLMYSDEAIIECRASGYRAAFPSDRANVAGRLLQFLSPYRPTTATYRVAWKIRPLSILASEANPSVTAKLASHRELWPLTPYVTATSVLVLICMPAALIFLNARHVLLPLACTYSAIVAQLTCLWKLKHKIGLSEKDFGLLAFQCLACPPIAPNLIRRMSMQVSIGADLVIIAKGMFDSVERRDVYDQIASRVSEKLATYDVSSPEHGTITAYLREIQTELGLSECQNIQDNCPIELAVSADQNRHDPHSEIDK